MVAVDAEAVPSLLAQLGYEVSAAQLGKHCDEAGTAVLVAEVDGRVVGVGASHTRWHLHGDGLVTSIGSLVVDQGSRSRGGGWAPSWWQRYMTRPRGSTLGWSIFTVTTRASTPAASTSATGLK